MTPLQVPPVSKRSLSQTIELLHSMQRACENALNVYGEPASLSYQATDLWWLCVYALAHLEEVPQMVITFKDALTPEDIEAFREVWKDFWDALRKERGDAQPTS